MNIIDLSSRISGLNTEKCMEILEETKKNNRRLNSCTGHDFRINDNPTSYTCLNCMAKVSGSYVAGYRQGLEHKKESL